MTAQTFQRNHRFCNTKPSLNARLTDAALGAHRKIPLAAVGEHLITTAPWLSIFPGLAIFLTVLGLNLLGDGLRDILDPQSRSRRA